MYDRLVFFYTCMVAKDGSLLPVPTRWRFRWVNVLFNKNALVMMKILAFARYNSGPCYHRLIAPLMLMNGVDVKITNEYDETDFEGVDIVMYNRVMPEEFMLKLAVLQVKHGFKICVDVDDFWELDEHHILYSQYQETNYAKDQIWHIENADMVFTTHDRLAAEILPYNKNVHIVPNAIPKQGQFDIERIASPFTRLFWQGSITHRADIELLQRPIECLKDIAGKIKMVMGGYMDGEPEWEVMTSDYTAGYKHQYKILEGTHVNDYYKNYAEADVCLIPLINSRFNRHKSNLKVLEAANLGLPVICSQVHPYMDLPVIYAKNSTDWVNHIKRMVASRKRQKEAGMELKEFVDTNYNFEKINRERKEIFEYQIATV